MNSAHRFQRGFSSLLGHARQTLARELNLSNAAVESLIHLARTDLSVSLAALNEP